MLMVHRLREYGSGRTEPINTNVCVLGDANKKQPNKSTSDNNPSRSIGGQSRKVPMLREVDSGSFVHTTSSTTTRYGTYSCVGVCAHINKSVCGPQKNISIIAALRYRVSSDEFGVYESNKQQVRENEIDMLTI